MSKKIVIISASPRKGGNSDLLCDEFMRGAIETGNHVEKIFLKDKTIHYCQGCGACYADGQSCIQKDDMTEILNKMIAADTIVMATPVYFYSMNAQMKTLIDRTCSRYTEINNKDFYFILAAADNNKKDMELTLDGLRGFTACLNGANEKASIYGIGAWHAGEIKSTPALKQAYEIGKAIN